MRANQNATFAACAAASSGFDVGFAATASDSGSRICQSSAAMGRWSMAPAMPRTLSTNGTRLCNTQAQAYSAWSSSSVKK